MNNIDMNNISIDSINIIACFSAAAQLYPPAGAAWVWVMMRDFASTGFAQTGTALLPGGKKKGIKV